MSDQSDAQTYHGHCHCGQFKFSLKVPTSSVHLSTCDCSICSRNAYKLILPIREEDLTIECGEDELKTYEFGSKNVKHLFCPTCGSSVMQRRKVAPAGEAVAINGRMLRDIDLSKLKVDEKSGKDEEPKYTSPKFPPTIEAPEGKKVYHGNCHCAAVTYSVTTKPLEELKPLSCNCSLCSRNGEFYIYPSKASVVVHTGGDLLTEYPLVSPDSLHTFCSTCGVSVLVRVLDEKADVVPLNIRTIDGVDLKNLNLQFYDGASKDPQYKLK